MSSKYKIDNHQALHFITFATVQWVDALSRPSYKNVIVDSIKYCQKEKGLLVYAWCIMSNHIHLIASAKKGYSLSDILRDFKKFTSKQLLKEISENGSESRRDWMLWIFRSAGQKNTNHKTYQFWQQDNRPVELSTNAMIDQRLDYIHMNPVKECIVYEPEHYVYPGLCNRTILKFKKNILLHNDEKLHKHEVFVRVNPDKAKLSSADDASVTVRQAVLRLTLQANYA